MQARIAIRLRSKKGTLPPNVAPLTDSSQPRASSAPRGRSFGNLGDSSPHLDPVPAVSPVPATSPLLAPPIAAIEIASGDTYEAGEEVDSAARTQPYTAKSPCEKAKSKGKEVAEGPSEPKKRKRKHNSSRSSRSNKHRRCSYWRREKLASDEMRSEAEKKLEDSENSRAVVAERVKQLEAQLEDLTFRSRIEGDTARTVALEVGKKKGVSAGCEAGKVEGLLAGRDASLASEMHKAFVKQTRLQGARDFLKSPAFQVAVKIKATNFLDQGFERCKSQVRKLKGFAEGFDLSCLS
ncbi:hypothetical protein Salat_2528600 [Sesamum alatum]|uniref:Uncharacterized protein n=1 Tax=Sesamum alatum TaxID=300844 RepID=A0AAE1XSW3_9LAMI|nr:hypothetical protein Salat_2528600 [Sesamum alatum]